MTVSVSAPTRWTLPMEADVIRQLLPHREPLLLLDRVIELEPGLSATGIKNVTATEPWFPGHFPQQLVMPGVIIVEAAGQVAGVAMATGIVDAGVTGPGLAYLCGIRRVTFRRLVRPGEQMVMHATKGKKLGALSEWRINVRVDGTLAVEGTLMIGLPGMAEDDDSGG